MAYLRDIYIEPNAISRNDFIDYLYLICSDKIIYPESFITAIYISDLFIHSNSIIIAYHCRFNEKPAEKIYSKELAHSALLLAVKHWQDFGYNDSKVASTEIENGFVFKLEWELYLTLNMSIPKCSLLQLLKYFPINELFFWRELSKIENIFQINPLSILLAFKLLRNKKKLKIIYRREFYKFCAYYINCGKNYFIELDEIINKIKNFYM